MNFSRKMISVLPCAALAFGLLTAALPGAQAVEDEVAAAPAKPAGPGHDLSLRQVRSADCTQGKDCEYVITVTNEGANSFTGVLNILRTASYRPTKHEGADGVVCKRKQRSVVCRTEPLTLTTGQSYAFTLSLAVPRSQGGEVKNCALLSFRGAEFADPYEDLVVIVQLALKSRGLYADGGIDGKSGKKLTKAVDTFRKTEGMPEGGIDTALMKALFGPAGLMADDANPENDYVCDQFELPEPKVVKVNRRVVRRVVRRAPAPRRTQTQSLTSRDSDNRGSNPRLDGLD